MIKFVYFDVGGVVIKDFSKTNKWLELQAELGLKPDESKDFDKFWDIYAKNSSLDLDVDSLQPLLEKHFKVTIPDNYSLLVDGFVNRFELNQSIWPVIKTINKNCKVGLLTNMYPRMFKAIKEKGLIPYENWGVIVDSSKVMLQKPDKKIFSFAQKLAKAKANEILFVDNSEKHINAASNLGWQVYLYDSRNYDDSSRSLEKWFLANFDKQL